MSEQPLNESNADLVLALRKYGMGSEYAREAVIALTPLINTLATKAFKEGADWADGNPIKDRVYEAVRAEITAQRKVREACVRTAIRDEQKACWDRVAEMFKRAQDLPPLFAALPDHIRAAIFLEASDIRTFPHRVKTDHE